MLFAAEEAFLNIMHIMYFQLSFYILVFNPISLSLIPVIPFPLLFLHPYRLLSIEIEEVELAYNFVS